MKVDMILHLNSEPFEMIKSGSKTIEMRLYDEKRRNLRENNIIEFINRVTNESLKVRIVYLHIFNNFKQLYNSFDKKKLGYKDDEVASPSDMNKYYSEDDQNKYGVVGIEIEKI